MSLSYAVRNVAPKPIPSQILGFDNATWPPTTSTLIWDDDGSLLVDCLITTAEAADLVDWIRSVGRPPDRVYITHPHADHMLGLNAVVEAFPFASPIALAESIPAMEGQVSQAAMAVWEGFFPGQLPRAPMTPKAMPGTTIPIGAAEASVIAVGATDTDSSTVVHVPELSLVVAGDVVYNNTHMWLYGSTVDTRASWRRALDRVDELGVSTVIAGHRDPATPDDDAHRQVDACRGYLEHFEAALADSESPQELIEDVLGAYPDLANPYTLWVAAFELLGPKP